MSRRRLREKKRPIFTIRIRRNAAIRSWGLSSYLALRRKVTLAGRTGRFTIRRAAEPIPVLWNCRDQTRSKSVGILVLHSWAETTFGPERTNIRHSYPSTSADSHTRKQR